MSERLYMHVSNVIWLEAFDQYREDTADRALYEAPKEVQEKYKDDAAGRISNCLQTVAFK